MSNRAKAKAIDRPPANQCESGSGTGHPARTRVAITRAAAVKVTAPTHSRTVQRSCSTAATRFGSCTNATQEAPPGDRSPSNEGGS